jgi:CRP/FNR family cyclic AMP-dependent transcriptional regulator
MRQLAERGELRRYRKGTLLIQEGELGGTLYFIEAGRVRAFSMDEDGEEFTFGYYGPGEYLGELSLDGSPRSASVIVEQALACRFVTHAEIRAAISEHPEIAFELLQKVTHRARVLSTRLRDLALHSCYGRLVALLAEQSEPQPDGTRLLREGTTQREIAMQIGCKRPMVTRLLGDLERGGYLRREEGRWRVQRALPPKW